MEERTGMAPADAVPLAAAAEPMTPANEVEKSGCSPHTTGWGNVKEVEAVSCLKIWLPPMIVV